MGPVVDVGAALLTVGVFWLPPIVAAAAAAGAGAGAGAEAGAGWHWGAGLVLAAGVGAGMVFRRRFPAAATLLVAAATVAGNLAGVCQDPMLGPAWCLYALAVARAARPGGLGLFLAVLAAGLATVTAVPGAGAEAGQRLVLAVGALSVAWLLGTAVGRQIIAARAAERAQAHLATARDVHDIVGHALGVIGAEAGVVRSLPDADERELRASLADIEAHARGALEEVQALVRALRSPPGPASAAGLGGAAGAGPGLRGLPPVLAATRAAGVTVETRTDVPGPVAEPVATVLLRIVQEALSNVVRHAPGAVCLVEVRQDGDRLVVRVRDDGPGAGGPGAGGAGGGAGPGFGLVGMRERAGQVGGDVTWGNRAGGGFEVVARLPVRSGP